MPFVELMGRDLSSVGSFQGSVQATSTNDNDDEELSAPRVSKWLHFNNPKEQQYYYQFLENRTSLAAILAACTLTAAYSTVIIATTLSNEGFQFVLLAHTYMLCVSLLGYFYAHVEYYRRGAVLPGFSPLRTSYCSWVASSLLSDILIVLWSVGSGVIMLQRSLVGNCSNRHHFEECNTLDGHHQLPPGALLANYFFLVVASMVFKVHSSTGIFVSLFVIVSFTIASAIASSAQNELFALVSLPIFTGFVLFDYEHCMLGLYLSQRNARAFYEDTLRAINSKKNADIESESMCSLIGNVAHDLKTPLQSFMSELGNLQVLLDKANISTSSQFVGIKETLGSLQNIYSFMMMAINRGIDFRKAIAGLSLQARNETFLISDAVHWAVSRFDTTLTGVELCITSPASDMKFCPMIICDKHWLSENILSLISNALKFTTKGSINIAYYLAAQTEAGIQQQSVVVYDVPVKKLFAPVLDAECKGKKFIIMLVEDMGVGVPFHIRSTLFQPFRQAQRRAGGTGLGLFSISKRMEALGGHCGVQGRDDGTQGACFWLAYPYVPDWSSAMLEEEIASASTESDAVHESSPHLNLNKSSSFAEEIAVSLSIQLTDEGQRLPPHLNRVLLIDDSLLILKGTSRMLRNEGFEVDVAQNGAAGLELMKSNSYVFVLSDIQMPIMDGIEMVTRFREFEVEKAIINESETNNASEADNKKKGLFIIGMSANSDIDTHDQALSCGMNRFIVKPVAKSTLRACLMEEYTHGVSDQKV